MANVYRNTPNLETYFTSQYADPIPRTLHTCWVGRETEDSKAMASLCRESFFAHHSDERWLHVHWTNESIPIIEESARISVSELLPKVSGAFKCDVIRTLVTLVYGGVYLDCDFTVHQNLEPLLFGRDAVFALQQDETRLDELGFGLANGFFAITPQHPFIYDLLMEQIRGLNALSDSRVATFDEAMEAVGVSAFNRVAERHLDSFSNLLILPQRMVFPYGYWEPDDVKHTKEAVLNHHWNGITPALGRMKKVLSQ